MAITIPESVWATCVESVGGFFQKIANVDPSVTAADCLAYEPRVKAARLLQRYTLLKDKKLLDVGSGFGVALAVFMTEFGADGYGVEPGGEGFGPSLSASRELLAANGIDPGRIVDGCGEKLPFPDCFFDIVYSSNSMEHVRNPELVLQESIRVLRPGGLLHFEIPNFMCYWEGHYIIPMPPILFRAMLPWWVKYVFRRDPAYAYTLNPLNPVWCRKQLRGLADRVQLVTMGEDVFLERLATPFEFNGQRQSSLGRIVSLIQSVNFGNWIGRTIIAAQGFHPIYLTLEKR